MKFNGLIRLATLVAVVGAVLASAELAHAADKKLPVVGRKLYPMRFNPEFSVMGDYSLATKYTSHVGLDFGATWHVWDQVAFEIHGGYLHGSESNIMKILRERSRTTREKAPNSRANPREPAVPGLQQLTYHLAADVQFAPIYGKLSFVSELESSFQLYGLGGLGIAGTRTKTDKTVPPICNGPLSLGGVIGGCNDFYVWNQKLFTLPGVAFGDQDIWGAGNYQILPLAVPVEYGLGLRLHLGKWVALRFELRNMHWLGVDPLASGSPLNVNEPGEGSCTTGYTIKDPLADSIAARMGATPCYPNLHTVSLARAGLSVVIPVNSFF